MRKAERKESRMMALADIWCRHGCLERMTIHVKKTGETITLINGIPMEQNVKTTDIPCAECGRPLPVGKPKFCSPICNSRFQARVTKLRKQKLAEESLQALKKAV
jgi:hypothetical protein